jgi:hypothetical protein
MSVKGSDAKTTDAKAADAKVAAAAAAIVRKVPKAPMPDYFNGERHKLKAFLVQTELYIGFSSDCFPTEMDKVLWATTLLRKDAFNWIETFVIDYMQNRNSEGKCTTSMSDDTIVIFKTFEGFKKRITRVFGDIDQERTAERHIQNLRQKGSAATYTAEFQQYMNKTDWNDDALKAQYYRGLKDAVKDEIARSDRPESLPDMIEMAIKIDNRHFERNLERRGQYSPVDWPDRTAKTGLDRTRLKKQTVWSEILRPD